MKKKRIVIKIGTNSLLGTDNQIDKQRIKNLVDEICHLKNENEYDFVIITSGAVGTGKSAVGSRLLRGNKITLKQTYAAIGQPKLMACYSNAFEKHDLCCGQVLITRLDFFDIGRRNNLFRNILLMLDNDIIPVINENDVITSEELHNDFTDNDQTAMLVSTLIEADLLIILSDVDGFFTGPPELKSSKLISVIDDVDDYVTMIFEKTSHLSKGGMSTKFQTAKTVTEQGIGMYIANGKKENTITKILKGEKIGTFFPPKKK